MEKTPRGEGAARGGEKQDEGHSSLEVDRSLFKSHRTGWPGTVAVVWDTESKARELFGGCRRLQAIHRELGSWSGPGS